MLIEVGNRETTQDIDTFFLTDFAVPGWTRQARYVLAEPWFLYEKPSYRTWLLATTPAPFKMRNIFGGDRMFNHVPRNTDSGKC